MGTSSAMPSARKAKIHYGTSSWSEPSWSGAFYPAGLKPAEQLSHYATQFAAVEADVTYYRVPDVKLVEGWAKKTPPGFQLCAKFPRSIVHGGDGASPDANKLLLREHVAADSDRFLSAMDLLGQRCGPLVLQFPYFNKQAFASLDPFLERLDGYLGKLPKQHRYAVEVRNKNWLKPALLAVLRQHSVALVLVDLVYMPHPDEIDARLDLLTTDFTYVRLIGDRKAIDALTTTFDTIVVDQSARLARWSKTLKEFMTRVPEMFVFANNHYAGYGPATIRTLMEMIERSA